MLKRRFLHQEKHYSGPLQTCYALGRPIPIPKYWKASMCKTTHVTYGRESSLSQCTRTQHWIVSVQDSISSTQMQPPNFPCGLSYASDRTQNSRIKAALMATSALWSQTPLTFRSKRSVDDRAAKAPHCTLQNLNLDYSSAFNSSWLWSWLILGSKLTSATGFWTS